jgi:hypothetical protein
MDVQVHFLIFRVEQVWIDVHSCLLEDVRIEFEHISNLRKIYIYINLHEWLPSVGKEENWFIW